MKLLLSIIFTLLVFACFSQKHAVERTWYNAEKTSKIKVYKAVDGKYYGKIVWLKTPTNANGQPRTDKENTNEKLQQRPLMDMLILSGFTTTEDPNVLEGGKVYDPNNGKTYCGKLTLKGNALDLRGFLCSMSMFGRTSEWTLAE